MQHFDDFGHCIGDAGGVLASCHCQCRLSATASLDELAGSTYHLRRVILACQIIRDSYHEVRLVVEHTAEHNHAVGSSSQVEGSLTQHVR